MKKANKVVAIIMATALILLLFYNVYLHFENEDKTQLAIMGTIETSVPVVGYVVRDEVVLVPDDGRVISSVKTNGERVAKGELVALVYNNEIDYETRERLADINEQIEKLKELKGQTSESETSGKFDSKIRTYVGNLIVNAHKGQGGGLFDATVQLEDAFSAKLASKSDDVNTAIKQLQEEKTQIEQSVAGEKSNVYASQAGVYLTAFDGYEGMFDYEKVLDITPSFLKSVDSVAAKASNGGAVKIADNFQWYFVANVESKKLTAEKPGNTVHLRLEDNSEEDIEVKIAAISPEEKGKSTVVLKGSTYVKQMFLKNKLEAELVLDASEGLKVSKDAVKVVDGVKGVYIIKKGAYAFREVDILANDDEYVIIERNLSTDKPHLALYDEVIVRGYDGE